MHESSDILQIETAVQFLHRNANFATTEAAETIPFQPPLKPPTICRRLVLLVCFDHCMMGSGFGRRSKNAHFCELHGRQAFWNTCG